MTDARPRPPRPESPLMTYAFARVYEAAAHRVTSLVSVAVLGALGTIGPGTRLLDIAAGAGALSVPAAKMGAAVLAVDVAPGMVRRLAERLQPFAGCEAREMDGQNLDLPDSSFDASVSVLGTMLFPDWRRGLREQARVLRPGGRGCVATWRDPIGAGPFVVMAAALRSVFPDRAPAPAPEGSVVLSDPERLAGEMHAAGFDEVEARQVDVVWEAPAGEAYLSENEPLHRYIRSYSLLDEAERRQVRAAIRAYVDERAVGGSIAFRSTVLVGSGQRG